MFRPPSEPPSDDSNPLGPLAHRMNHTLSYLVNHLNLLTESVQGSRLAPDERGRITQMTSEALESAERLADLIRQLKLLSWGAPAARTSRMDRPLTIPPADDDLPESDEDTWDSEHSARILVVDDEPAILQACQRALSTYLVEVAGTSGAATDILERMNFDLVLYDLTMSGMSGVELYEWFKRKKADRLDRVVFMTGGVFSSQLRTFLSSIRNPVLHKPFDTKTLRWMIAQKLREFDAKPAATAPGSPNPGSPNPGIPNPGIPNPGSPNPGIPNPGILKRS